jgi:hypothetical protein
VAVVVVPVVGSVVELVVLPVVVDVVGVLVLTATAFEDLLFNS